MMKRQKPIDYSLPLPRFAWVLPAALRLPMALIFLLAGVIVLLKLVAPLNVSVGGAVYLPLHIIMEVFAVVVSALVFGIGWHSTTHQTPQGIVVLSAAFLVIGLLDLGHMLSFQGMPQFVTPSSPSKAINFWLASRAIGAFALLAAMLLPWTPFVKAWMRHVMLAMSLVITGLTYWIVLWCPEILPETYIAGSGLTPFKVHVEYVLVFLYVLAALILARRTCDVHPYNAAYLFTSACIMALSEVCFTLYTDVADMFNLLGHVYKVFAYYCLYRAIFVEGVQQPFQKLTRSEQSFKNAAKENAQLIAILEATPDFVICMDTEMQITYVNRAGRTMMGIRDDAEVIQTTIDCFMPAWAIQMTREQGMPMALVHGRWIGETALLGKDGKEIPVSQVVFCHKDGDGNPAYWSIICSDISTRKSFEAVLLEQLTHDALTGLPNRLFFNDRLQLAIGQASRISGMLAVLVLGIDHFKNVNDTLSHACGDDLLRESARRMQEKIGSDDLLARQGGDEFIILLPCLNQHQDVVTLAEQLLSCMREPFYVAGKEIFLSASLGISVFPTDERTRDGLLRNADMAMNHAKKAGRNCYRFHDSDMDQRIQERLELEACLRYAIENNELFLHYQPRVSLVTGEMIGMEALLRWQHPVLGLVSPVRFIPVAEESGLIELIGLWVLREAGLQARAWQAQGIPNMRLSINLSARQFHQSGLIDSVQKILEECCLDPKWLELEITEGTVMHDTESAIKTLRSFKQLGVALSIDDFGTGYSSLSYLKLFPIDVLKIDRSFVKDVINDTDDAAITRAIVALAHSLDLDVVAEGVETLAQAIFLKSCGCDEMQGYYFSRPLPANEMTRLLLDKNSMHIPGIFPVRHARVVELESEPEPATNGEEHAARLPH